MMNAPTASTTLVSLPDLASIAEHLSRFRIVLLGENGHGVAEFSRVKVALIELLHGAGFDLLVVESGLAECFGASEALGAATSPDAAREALRSSLYSTWRTTDVLPLFEYMQASRSTATPLHFTGLDPRPVNRRSTFLHDTVAQADAAIAGCLSVVEEQMHRFARRGFISTEGDRAEFQHLREGTKAVYDAAARVVRNDPALSSSPAGRVCWQVLESRAELLKVIEHEAAYFDFRERWMAKHLAWIAQDLYPERKIIVWAHNYHIRKRQSAVDGDATMGEYLPASLWRETYAVGLYMNQGHAVWNDWTVYEIPPAPAGTMEAKLSAVCGRMGFVDLQGIAAEPGHWLNRPCQVMSWGVTPERITPSEQYDGVLFVREVSAPESLRERS